MTCRRRCRGFQAHNPTFPTGPGVVEAGARARREVFLIGQTLSHYRITSALGAGGMGEVYRAVDASLHRDVAIKVLPPEVAQDPDRLARFRREAHLLASLNHPGIAAIYGLEEADGKPSRSGSRSPRSTWSPSGGRGIGGVSVDGGGQAKWREDGRELFYTTPDSRLMAVQVRADGERLEVSLPAELFAIRGLQGPDYDDYAVSPDGQRGQRFLVDTRPFQGQDPPNRSQARGVPAMARGCQACSRARARRPRNQRA